jgi:hypothetical protein
MVFEKVEFRGVVITADHLKGCYIDNLLFIPNGTGPERILESEKLGFWARRCLQSLKSDKWQKTASFVHDILYMIGGTEADRLKADQIMLQIAIGEVMGDSELNPVEKLLAIGTMYRNKYFVGKLGKGSFYYHDREVNLKSTRDYECELEYNRLKRQGLIK